VAVQYSNEAVAKLQDRISKQESRARAREEGLHRQETEKRSLAFWSVVVFLVAPIVLGLLMHLAR